MANVSEMPRIAVSGGTGLVGSAVIKELEVRGRKVARLVRRPAKSADEIQAECEAGTIDREALNGIDAVDHLAGESIAAGRWTAARKARIRDSRVLATQRLCAALAALPSPPRVLIAASAIGFYGDRGDERLTEESTPGTGFLADVCQAWESATQPAIQASIRVVHLRTGMVLARNGGALRKMLTPFRVGVGGKIGSGRQWMSWIELTDLVAVVCRAIDNDALQGPLNAVSPQPVTNLEFTKTLGSVLCRPTILPLPGAMARLLFGEMANELLLASQQVLPQKLLANGFPFKHAALLAALQDLLA